MSFQRIGPWLLWPIERPTPYGRRFGVAGDAAVRVIDHLPAWQVDDPDFVAMVQGAIRESAGFGPRWLKPLALHRLHGEGLLECEAPRGWGWMSALRRRVDFPMEWAAHFALSLGDALRTGAFWPTHLERAWLLHDGTAAIEVLVAGVEVRGVTRTAGVLRGGVHWLTPEELRGEPRTELGWVHTVAVAFAGAVFGGSPFDRDTDIGTVDAILSGDWRGPRSTRPLPEVVERFFERAFARPTPGFLKLESALEALRPLAKPPPLGELERWLMRDATRSFHFQQLAQTELEAHRHAWAAEALVLERPEADAHWAVLADALQAKGSVRGEWLALARHGAADARARLEQEHPWLVPPVAVEWVGPRAERLLLADPLGTPPVGIGSVSNVLRHASLRTLRKLDLSRLTWWLSVDPRLEALLEELPRTLEDVKLPGAPPALRAVLRAALPRLVG